MLSPPAELYDLARQLDPGPYAPLEPCDTFSQYTEWSHRTGKGILAFATDGQSPHDNNTATLTQLETFDQHRQPHISTRTAFAALSAAYRPPETAPDTYLTQIVNQKRTYGTAANHDHEARAFAATHFTQCGQRTTPDHVQIFSGGTANILDAFLRAVINEHEDYLVAVTGLEIPCHQGPASAAVILVEDFTDDVLDEWLGPSPNDLERTALYVPLVNRLTGQILTQERALAIAAAVLRFNRNHPQRPVHVLADDSDLGSNHSPDIAEIARPLGIITGLDVGDTSLGKMSDWTLTVATPGTLYGLPHPQISFAITGNQHLRNALIPATNPNTYTSTTPLDELDAAAALCLTPHHWIEETNSCTLKNLRTLRHAIGRINNKLGFDALTLSNLTAAGRYTAIRLHPRLFPVPLDLTIDSLTKTRCTMPEHSSTTVQSELTELFQWYYHHPDTNRDPRLTLRTNLTLPPETLEEMIKKLDHVATALAKPDLVITTEQREASVSP
jgi:hypothetical protein